jgi:hypothetical protein
MCCGSTKSIRCILNRSFGLRQLTKWGVHCILVRDLTDAMYNPASRPYVSHTAGTDLVGCLRVTFSTEAESA